MAENDPPPGGGSAPPPATDAAATAAAAAAAAKPTSQPGEAAAAAGSETPPPKPGETPAGAPDKYALTIPADTPLDAADVTAFETLARTHNLTNEQAQAAFAEHATAIAAHNKAWLDATTADAEVGGTHLAQSQQLSNQVLDKFLPASEADGAELRAVLTKQGLGAYRPIVKLLSRIGKAMGEDQPLTDRGGGQGGKRSHADRLFGDSKT